MSCVMCRSSSSPRLATVGPNLYIQPKDDQGHDHGDGGGGGGGGGSGRGRGRGRGRGGGGGGGAVGGGDGRGGAKGRGTMSCRNQETRPLPTSFGAHIP